MASLDTLVKKRSAYKTFCSDVKNGLGHAYLFVCEDGLSREKLLSLCAKRVFCSSACGECAVCQSIDEGNFLDVTFFDGAEMKVADTTALTEKAMVRPVVGDKKIFLLNNADKLNPQSQNKLLKTYEEPPKYLTVILACASENGILATIKSRAKKLYFDGLTSKEIVDVLVEDGAENERASVAAAIAGGSLEKAEKFLNSDSFVELYNACFSMMTSLDKSADIPQLALSENFSKDNAAITFDILEIILSDVMRLTSDSRLPLLNGGREYDIKNIAKKFNAQSAAASIAAVNEGRMRLSGNVSPLSCGEYVLFNILEARHKWQ